MDQSGNQQAMNAMTPGTSTGGIPPAGAAPVTTTAAPGQANAGGGDYLDKMVQMGATKSGRKVDRGTIEKISDGLRKLFRKVTGKEMPIKDQEYK